MIIRHSAYITRLTLALVVVAVFSGCPRPKVVVPNVVSLTQANAETAIKNAKLTVGTVTQQYHATAHVGHVISQNPAAGTQVRQRAAVALVVSLGPQPVTVPDVVGMTQSAAEIAITSAGLAVGTVTGQFSEIVPSGQIITQNPAADESVLPGTAIDLVASLGEEPIAFDDPYLEQAIRDAINKHNGDIYASDLVGLTELDADSRGIASLNGLENCTDLIELYLAHNRISALSPLSSLARLEVAGLMYNEIEDIAALSPLTNLTEIDLLHNEIADINALSGLDALAAIDLSYNHIDDLAPLSGLSNLVEVSLAYNEIDDVSPLEDLDNVAILELAGNEITDIGSLLTLDSLLELYLVNNPLSQTAICDDIPVLQGNGVTVVFDGACEDKLFSSDR